MEGALRRRFVFYAALKSRFTAPFSAANNSDDDDDRVDEQKKDKRRGLCLSLLPLLSSCPSATLPHPPSSVPQVFSTKTPSFCSSVPSFHMATGNFYTHKDIFLRGKKRKERTRGETPTWARKEGRKKRKMESLKPATCVKTFRHSFVRALSLPCFPVSLLP